MSAAESTIHREQDGAVGVYRLRGSFDRAAAWALRDRLESDPASEILIDFSLVPDLSDLAVAVLAHCLTAGTRRFSFRGLRQHQLRILRYCGIPVSGRSTRSSPGIPVAVPADARSSSGLQ